MSRLEQALVLVAATVMAGSMTALAAQEAGSNVTVAQDLTAVIALQGKPCGKVVNATEQGENDYLATCQDGNRYRIYTNADGRVIVEKRN